MINKIEIGWIWESVEGSVSTFYEILNNDEEIMLRRLIDNQGVKRYRGQVASYGLTRPRRKSDPS